ncbi:MAG: hypothetical protein K0S47_4150 [Herbinix sp.]|jgi:allophanate hydrolase subunit 1|nr:hypothetical protein [Herbinix sp.]
MHKIIVDVLSEIVFIELSRNFQTESIKDYVADLNKLTVRFDARTYSMLILADRLDPLSQESIPEFQKVIEIALTWSKKIAVVHGNRTLTLMQMKRIEAEARKKTNSEIKVMRFITKYDAIQYLTESRE